MIDAHHHLWHYSPADYPWIPPTSVLARDYLAADLTTLLHSAGIDGAVSVQARQTLEETRWLLEVATSAPIIKGVVGWVPLIDAGVAEHLDRFSSNPTFVGVRHVLQDEPDDRYMLRDDFQRGLREVTRRGLRYDLLVYARHLPHAIELVDRHPEQVFILDHIAKPAIRSRQLSPWREDIRALARRPHVYCKLSGMANEAMDDQGAWSTQQLKPYVDVVLEAFGPSRLMFGSDWPVALLATDYPRWLQTARDLLGALSPHEQDAIFGKTAQAAYKLSV